MDDLTDMRPISPVPPIMCKDGQQTNSKMESSSSLNDKTMIYNIIPNKKQELFQVAPPDMPNPHRNSNGRERKLACILNPPSPSHLENNTDIQRKISCTSDRPETPHVSNRLDVGTRKISTGRRSPVAPLSDVDERKVSNGSGGPISPRLDINGNFRKLSTGVHPPSKATRKISSMSMGALPIPPEQRMRKISTGSNRPGTPQVSSFLDVSTRNISCASLSPHPPSRKISSGSSGPTSPRFESTGRKISYSSNRPDTPRTRKISTGSYRCFPGHTPENIPTRLPLIRSASDSSRLMAAARDMHQSLENESSFKYGSHEHIQQLSPRSPRLLSRTEVSNSFLSTDSEPYSTVQSTSCESLHIVTEETSDMIRRKSEESIVYQRELSYVVEETDREGSMYSRMQANDGHTPNDSDAKSPNIDCKPSTDYFDFQGIDEDELMSRQRVARWYEQMTNGDKSSLPGQLMSGGEIGELTLENVTAHEQVFNDWPSSDDDGTSSKSRAFSDNSDF